MAMPIRFWESAFTVDPVPTTVLAAYSKTPTARSVERKRGYVKRPLFHPSVENSVANPERRDNDSTIWERLTAEEKRLVNKLKDKL